MTDDSIMGYGKEVAHWLCECGQPNAKERNECIDCGKIPKEKKFRKKQPRQELRGRRKSEYY